MSSSTATPRYAALAVAAECAFLIEPYCHRVEIAGSLRRGAPFVHDIEIVAVPILAKTLFGGSFSDPNAPTPLDTHMRQFGPFALHKDGPKYKQFSYSGLKVDLFLQPDPATWGVNFLIRTGSSEFSRLFVTQRRLGGLLPDHLFVRHGRIWKSGSVNEALRTDEEMDAFYVAGLPFVPPDMRTDGLWRRFTHASS